MHGVNKLGPLGSAAHCEPAPTRVGLLGTDADGEVRWQRKERQNRAFRGGGLAVLVLGVAGFAPSVFEALRTGALWSVSHNTKHTDTAFLGVHAVSAVIWMMACIAQFYTGGVPKYAVGHHVCGYVGASGLIIAMVSAAANELQYATPDADLGTAYTMVLVFGATVNLGMGIVRARQGRFPEHKDSVLLALMFTMDPAVHRLMMWTIRFIVDGWTMTSNPPRIDPMQLLILGKMPANLILYVTFGWIFVRGRRVNCVTVLCTSFNAVAFLGGATLSFVGAVRGSIASEVWGLTLAGTIMLLLATAAFVVEIRAHAKGMEG